MVIVGKNNDFLPPSSFGFPICGLISLTFLYAKIEADLAMDWNLVFLSIDLYLLFCFIGAIYKLRLI